MLTGSIMMISLHDKYHNPVLKDTEVLLFFVVFSSGKNKSDCTWNYINQKNLMPNTTDETIVTTAFNVFEMEPTCLKSLTIPQHH